jgi:Holliday junction resolvase
MAGRASKIRGKAGERSFRDKIREFGFDAERGWADGYDIKSVDLGQFSFEVKYQEYTRFPEWMRQAKGDCAGTKKIPVVAHRSNRGDWHVFMAADDFLALLKKNTSVENTNDPKAL